MLYNLYACISTEGLFCLVWVVAQVKRIVYSYLAKYKDTLNINYWLVA